MEQAGVGLGDALMLANKNNGNEMWNNPFVYLILLAAFGGGFGGFGFGGANAAAANMNGMVTRAELSEGLDNQDIKAGIRGIQNGLCDGFYTTGMAIKDNMFAVQNVGCEINRNIDALRAENNVNTCKITTAIHEEGEATRALITQNTIQALRDKVEDKDRELLYYKLKGGSTTAAA